LFDDVIVKVEMSKNSTLREFFWNILIL
jgi:hypothetical protein